MKARPEGPCGLDDSEQPSTWHISSGRIRDDVADAGIPARRTRELR